MLIAKCPIKGITPPRELYEHSYGDIDTDYSDLPHGADAWITCTQGLPHYDPSWSDQFFLTLTIDSDEHKVGDSNLLLQDIGDQLVPRGSLFVVDPMVPHWLLNYDAVLNGAQNVRWVGLQWEVPRDTVMQRARELVTLLNGSWVNVRDSRYANWQVHGEKGTLDAIRALAGREGA